MRIPNRSVARGHGRRGAAASELAVVVLFLAPVLVAVVDFARVFHAEATLYGCARNGALYGCLSPANSTDATGIQNAAVADGASLSPALTAAKVSSSTPDDADGNPSVLVQVNDYQLQLLMNYPGVGGTAHVSCKVQMRVAPTAPSSS